MAEAGGGDIVRSREIARGDRHTVGVSHLRPWFALALILWMVLLVQPYGRTDLYVQLKSLNGGYQYINSDYPSGYIVDSPPLPSAAALLREYPRDREVVLGLAETNSRTQR